MMRLKAIRTRALLTASFVAAGLLAGCAPTPAPLPPPPVHASGQVLWQIVHGRCLPGQTLRGDPAPCAAVAIAGGVDRGYAVLKDIAGTSQYLVMPTRPIPGIESAALLAPGATNYFTPAWRARALVEQQLGTALARADVSIAVNSIYGRSQDLLHLHVDCVRADVRDALKPAVATIGRRWSRQPLMLAGHGYRAIRIDGDDALAANPFLLVHRGLHVPAGEMAGWTVIVTGMDFPDGRPGFVLLAARADPAAGYDGSGEALQDHACAGRSPLSPATITP